MKTRKILTIALLSVLLACAGLYGVMATKRSIASTEMGPDQQIVASEATPLTDNPWRKYRAPAPLFQSDGSILQTEGMPADTDPRTGKPMLGTGTYPWHPGAVTLDTGLFSGYRLTQEVPGAVVPVDCVGTVYYQPVSNRLKISAKQDASRSPANVPMPSTRQIDRPTGGISFVVWVQPAGADWPETTSIDLATIRSPH